MSYLFFSASASDNGEVLIAVAVGRVIVFSTFGTIAITFCTIARDAQVACIRLKQYIYNSIQLYIYYNSIELYI